ncbi:beta-amyrin 11-oxidase [Gossypium raimondii]|uniref:beta-amyrin 11-oxidase n=1 Tax=Gossypium raimondii TaxID=29730 RepID=UPI00227BB1B6|nr:beta-amyrin 11-oxidase [Gossypium raimondii]
MVGQFSTTRHIEDVVITSLEELATMNRPIKFFNEMKTIALNVIAKVSLGSTQDSILWSMVKYYTELSPGILSMPINIPGFAFHRALKTKDELDERRRKTVAERKKGMMDLLMEVENEIGEKLEDKHINDLLLLILFSGRETAAHTAMWVRLELVLEHTRRATGDHKEKTILPESLTLTEIKEIEYLPKVIDESLRRNYFAFAIYRKVVANVNINGYTIPKGWKVLVWPTAIYMDHIVNSKSTFGSLSKDSKEDLSFPLDQEVKSALELI